MPVTVANTSLAVTNADTARQAVSGSLVLSGPTFCAPDGTVYTVPIDKRLVIDTVTVVGNHSDLNSYTIEVDTTQGGTFRQTFLNLLPTGAPFPAFSQSLRLYVDPGTQVKVLTSSNGHNSTFIGFSFFSHLVDL